MAFPHRTICDTLEEMRDITKKSNFYNYKKNVHILSSLIEECQVYANRMEAGLSYGHDIVKLHDKRKQLLKEVENLKEFKDA